MKKLFVCILMFLFLSSLFLPVYAEFTNPSVTDEAGYLLQSELKELSQKLDEIRYKYNLDVAIYTESYMTSYSAEASADDIYDYNGYGAGKNSDGIMLYICSDTREYHFTTHGKGLEYFNSNGLKYLESKVLPYLEDDDYYSAFTCFAETVQELAEMGEGGNPYNKTIHSTKYILGVVAVCVIAPLIIAFFMMTSKLKKMKTAVKNDYAANYVKPGSINIEASRDLFMYSVVTKTAKPKSSSGTHTSSSGRTHGGRGGRF